MDADIQDSKSAAYQLDSSSRELQYRPHSDLSVLRPSHREALSAGLFTASDRVLCWAEGARVWSQDSGRPQCIQNLTQPVVYVTVRKDGAVLAVVTESQVLAQDLDRNTLVMTVSKQDPGYQMAVWHPSDRYVLGAVYQTDLVVYQLSEHSEQIDPVKTKSISQSLAILSFSFSPEASHVVTVALEGGLIRTIDVQSEVTLFETRPHAMSPLYTNALLAFHLPNSHLLTLGKSLNELSIWNWVKKEKEQTLNISGFTPEYVTVLHNRCYLVDCQNKAISVVTISEAPRFVSIVDYNLDISGIKGVEIRSNSGGETEILVLGNGTFEIFPIKSLLNPVSPFKSSRSKPASHSVQIPSDQFLLLQRRLDDLQTRLETGGFLTHIQEQVDKVINDYMEKLSSIIKDEQQKIQVSMKVLLAQAFKDQFQSAILPIFEAAVKEMFTQATLAFQEGVKEFTERNALEEAHFQSVLQHMKASVEATTELTTKLGKVAFKQLKRLGDVEVKMSEKAIVTPISRPELKMVEEVPALKLELDRLLRNEEFETAIVMVMSESDERMVYRVLKVMNPAALYRLKPVGNAVSLRLCHRILTHFPSREELPEYLQWLQEICRNVVLKGEDPNIVQNILEMMVSRSKTSPELSPAKETFFSKIIQDMQDRRK